MFRRVFVELLISSRNYSPHQGGAKVGYYGIYVSPHSGLRFSRKALPPS